MLEAQKEKVVINKLISEKKQIFSVESDMIIPDSKPDVLNTICTSGVVSVYKKAILEGKIKLEGNINTYIMYLPDGTEDNVRGVNTIIGFSEIINDNSCKEGMLIDANIKINNIDTKVLNGRKVSIKASIEIFYRIYSKEEIELISDIRNLNDIQIKRQNCKLNSLLGLSSTKIYAKDNISIDEADDIAEILKVSVGIVDRDIKISYNKVLTKAEAEISLVYLAESNKVNMVNYKIPIVGFVDIQDVTENNICDTNYEIKNIIIKPNSKEQHSIYVEIEFEVSCNIYEEKEMNLIEDLYSPGKIINFDKKNIITMTDKKNITDVKQIRERVKFNNIGQCTIIDGDVKPVILKETKINSKILHEGELRGKFILQTSKNQINFVENTIPFNYTIDNLKDGENLMTENIIDIKNKRFTMEDDGEIECNVDLGINTNMYKNVNLNIIDNIEEGENRNCQNYSLIIYIVKKGDTLWNIAKKYESTVEMIKNVNNLEDVSMLKIGQKLYIPKYEKVLEKSYE